MSTALKENKVLTPDLARRLSMLNNVHRLLQARGANALSTQRGQGVEKPTIVIKKEDSKHAIALATEEVFGVRCKDRTTSWHAPVMGVDVVWEEKEDE